MWECLVCIYWMTEIFNALSGLRAFFFQALTLSCQCFWILKCICLFFMINETYFKSGMIIPLRAKNHTFLCFVVRLCVTWCIFPQVFCLFTLCLNTTVHFYLIFILFCIYVICYMRNNSDLAHICQVVYFCDFK